MASTPHPDIYQSYAAEYDLLRSRMDYENNILSQITNIVTVDGADIVELAAGTGRITGLLAPMAKSIKAFDRSEHMIRFAREKLRSHVNCDFIIADNMKIPLPDAVADIVLEGWSLGYMVAAAQNHWKRVIDKTLSEMNRLLRPGGTIVILGTLGTGAHKPQPPNPQLADLYLYLESEKGFSMTPWFKTDYKFESLEEAQRLVSFFWSEDFGHYVSRNNLLVLPECTAIWHHKKDKKWKQAGKATTRK